ncbi:MAG: hypothetical protein OXT67_10870 [Zetaproteobacteria bacterium]|nr:hypothetical protein [Zetaproteobacteria bacterium]
MRIPMFFHFYLFWFCTQGNAILRAEPKNILKDLPPDIQETILTRVACDAPEALPNLCMVDQKMRTQVIEVLGQQEVLAAVVPTLLVQHPGWMGHMLQHLKQKPHALAEMWTTHHPRWLKAAEEAGKQDKEPEHLLEMLSMEDMQWNLFLQNKKRENCTPIEWKRYVVTVLTTYAATLNLTRDATYAAANETAHSAALHLAAKIFFFSNRGVEAVVSAIKNIILSINQPATDPVLSAASTALSSVATDLVSIRPTLHTHLGAAADAAFSGDDTELSISLSLARDNIRESYAALSTACAVISHALPFIERRLRDPSTAHLTEGVITSLEEAKTHLEQAYTLHKQTTAHLINLNTTRLAASSTGASAARLVASCYAEKIMGVPSAAGIFELAKTVARNTAYAPARSAAQAASLSAMKSVSPSTVHNTCVNQVSRTLGRIAYRVAETEAWMTVLDPERRVFEKVYAAVHAKLGDAPEDFLDQCLLSFNEANVDLNHQSLLLHREDVVLHVHLHDKARKFLSRLEARVHGVHPKKVSASPLYRPRLPAPTAAAVPSRLHKLKQALRACFKPHPAH